MHPEKVTITKPNGTIIENVDADVQTKMIFFNDPTLPLQVGDVVERTLPSGLSEKFEVTDPGFISGGLTIGSHFQTKFKRWEPSKPAVAPQPTNVTYNLHGQNSKVNIGSVDNSVINGGNTQTLYQELRKTIQENVVEADRPGILAAVDTLENAGAGERAGAFGNFVAKAANYIEILSPFIKALGGLIS